jgi:hypothetical protein
MEWTYRAVKGLSFFRTANELFRKLSEPYALDWLDKKGLFCGALFAWRVVCNAHCAQRNLQDNFYGAESGRLVGTLLEQSLLLGVHLVGESNIDM